MSKRKNKMNRRGFLKKLGATTAGAFAVQSPFEMLVNSIIQGQINVANANQVGVKPRNYVFLQQPGANPRWTFDLLLTPYNTGAFTQNPHVGTAYTGNTRRTGVTYSTYEFTHSSGEVLNLPILWNYPVPSPGGGTRPMTDLLDHFFSIRGINTQNAGHPGSQEQQFRPLGAKYTLAGLVSDQSSAPIPSINVNSQRFNFGSTKGNVSVPLNNSNQMLSDLLDPFISDQLSNIQRKSVVQGSIDASLDALARLSQERHPASSTLAKSRKDAQELLNDGFTGLQNEWNTLYNKYLDLTVRATNNQTVMAGINDLPIGTTGNRNRSYDVSENNPVTNADMRTMIQNNTSAVNMARHFAVAEYVIKNGLSNAIHITPTQLNNLAIQTANGNRGGFGFDEHSVGAMVTLIVNSMYHRALAACMLEFISQMKTANLWDETVLQTGGEFNRSPHNNMWGSDHGWQGASTNIYSGVVKAPMVIGNIEKDTPQDNYPGTWGFGAANGSAGRLNTGHIGATLASFLRTPSPVTAVSTLVNVTNNGVVSLIGKGSQV